MEGGKENKGKGERGRGKEDIRKGEKRQIKGGKERGVKIMKVMGG